MSNAANELSHYDDLIALRKLSPGRLIFSCNQTLGVIADLRAEATAANVPLPKDQEKAFRKLETHLIDTRTSAQSALNLNAHRKTQLSPSSKPSALPALKPIDNLADKLLSSFHKNCKQTRSDFPPTHPRSIAATALIASLFPNGIRAIIHAAAVDQLAHMQRILEACATTLQNHIQTLHLTDLLDQLSLITQDYALALQPATANISGAQVAEAERAANTLLRQSVAIILGDFIKPHLAPLRQKLLASILFQNESAYRARQLNQADTDIDPVSGVDFPPQIP